MCLFKMVIVSLRKARPSEPFEGALDLRWSWASPTKATSTIAAGIAGGEVRIAAAAVF